MKLFINVSMMLSPNSFVILAKPTQVCGAPPAIINGLSQVSGNKATYTCNPGYFSKAGTPTTIICSGTTWIFTTMPACSKSHDMSCFMSYIPCHVSHQTELYWFLSHHDNSTKYFLLLVVDPTKKPPPAKCLKSPPCGDATITRAAAADSYDVC